ncbi:SDR family oxidoreductase [Nocardia sp. NPDC004860]|uniref:SDR family oxidoreductase n=1 Tax=Nocardia sp. NPDC004860 TaxID=3154557 RepID=UPI0033B66076
MSGDRTKASKESHMRYQSVFTPGLFDGRTVVITGGGSGIGRCTAHELAALGARVAIIGRDPDKLARVRGEIEADGGLVSTHAADIRDEPAIIAVIEEILAEHGRIDGLFNNAGGQYRSPLESITTKGFEAVVRNNLTGGFIVMREVYNRWMKENGGAIVNMIADIWHGWPHFSHSAASRGGMLTLSESAATEWAASGVRVNTVAPGSIASSGLDTYDPKDTEFIQKKVAREIPLQRFGTESEVSAAIVFMLSPAANFITGTCLRIDGGAPNAKPGWWDLAPAERNEPFDGFHRSTLPDILAGRTNS